MSYNRSVMTAKAISMQNIVKLSDAELISTAISGREDSFEEIVRRYQRPIVGYIYRMLGNQDSAADVSQEVFIKVYNSLSKYSSEYKFSTWLYKIAHNATIDFIRRNSHHTQSLEMENEDGTFEFQLESKRPTPEQERERTEWRTEIEGVVNRLPNGYRELILLRHSQDMSYDEIAEITNLPLGTVKNRLFRAREIMREMFVEKGITSV
jgi:RNA polymerase sigma-70 factor, ECF subfamily